MKKMNVLLIANGEIKDYEYTKRFVSEYDAVYCCDGGIKHCEQLGLFPNVIVGDFDSSLESSFDKYIKTGAEIFKFPSEKDFSDTELGLIKAVEDGATNITILGGLGKRFDHALANAHILMYALENRVTARLVDEHSEIVLINKEISINGKPGDIISLIPLTTEVVDVTITGVKYPLSNKTLKAGSGISFSISNVIVNKTANISLSSGLLFVILARD
ncbi:MAG: thiamine diphosphokinase [Defluviitaleaceae bacterium]|nr:thiamine diphosphokinase [Defluviitaleaceae bacterium]